MVDRLTKLVGIFQGLDLGDNRVNMMIYSVMPICVISQRNRVKVKGSFI